MFAGLRNKQGKELPRTHHHRTLQRKKMGVRHRFGAWVLRSRLEAASYKHWLVERSPEMAKSAKLVMETATLLLHATTCGIYHDNTYRRGTTVERNRIFNQDRTWRLSTISLSSIPLLICRESNAYEPMDSRYGTPSTTSRADTSSAAWLAAGYVQMCEQM